MVEEKTDSNVVYIGKKETMAYVLAVITQFKNGAKEVFVRARGNMISRAVDVAEIVKARFPNEAKVKEVGIGTDDVPNTDGSRSKVSMICITLEKA